MSAQAGQKKTPNEFLKQVIGRPVVVKLNNGIDYRGTRRGHGAGAYIIVPPDGTDVRIVVRSDIIACALPNESSLWTYQ